MTDLKNSPAEEQARSESIGSEMTIEQRATEGLSLGTLVRRKFLRHKVAVASLIVIVLIAVIAFTSVGTVIGGTGKLQADPDTGKLIINGFRIPGWWKYNWYETYALVNPGGAPTLTLWPFSIGDHPFGQDTVGKDIFARVMRGIQQSYIVIILVGLLATVIGTVIGAVAGYFRGMVDSLLMRMTDVILIVPVLVLGAVLGRTVGGNAPLLGIMLGLIAWPLLARLVRAEFLSLREREFVDAARVAGAGSARIIFRHILPNTVGVIIVNSTLLMSAAILIETGLSFLGFGIKSPDISLGQIISEYSGAFNTRPWLFWWPGLFIIIIALAINFVGDGLRDAFDPRQKGMPNLRPLRRQAVDMFRAFTTRRSAADTSEELRR